MHVQEYDIGPHEKGAKVTVDLGEPTGKNNNAIYRISFSFYKVKKRLGLEN
ncbi:hypothetical protein GCM10020331_098100 [Ectobacillus funiculus]